jgi:polyribonucleotide nucleotidyltransferase
MKIPKEFIGAVIGPGGKIIQEMQRETGAIIMIEEAGEFGIIDIASSDQASTDAAIARIRAIVAVPEVGEIYTGKVKNIMDFGAFVEILPGKDGLLHISEIDWKRFDTVQDSGINVGDILEVKLIDIDKKTGKYKLSRKALLPKPEGYVAPPEREHRERDNRDNRGGDRRDNRDNRGDRDNRNNRR